ncbi:MAG: alkene reductase [Desulfocapsaceae bacterium]
MTNELFTPIKVGNLKLANRAFMAPMTRGRAGESRVANELIAEYYRQRAEAGLIVTEATAVSADGYGWVGAPAIYTDEQQRGWQKTTEAVHRAGGVIFLQLWHMGRVSHPDFLDAQSPVGPSAVAAQGESVTPAGKKPYVVPRELSVSDLSALRHAYGAATVRALEAGFDGVEIHSANGYLLDQFLRDGSNRRNDEYGGTIENRMRFPLEIVDTVVEKAGCKRVGLRISPVNAYNDMKDSNPAELFSSYAGELDKRGLAYLHVLEALPGHFLHTEGYDPVLPEIRKAFNSVLVANGGYDYQSATELIRSGGADVVAFGIPFLANPDLLVRFKSGAELNQPDMDTFYSAGTAGYTDYPFLDQNG